MSPALSPEERLRLDELFERAVDLPVEEHAAFLERECASHASLRTELARLLAGLAGEDRLDRARPAASLLPGTFVGPYRILEKIGEGGMGEVYLAEQTAPLVRRVALKLVKAGMDTRQVIARFEAERQALAVMDHPGIAKVFDAGSTDAGRPYFVMEHIQGVPVLEYCDAHELDMEERLRLFVSICHAIQHAHQKGIIHRDVKPSNVLVTLHDGRPVPKVIDFGIAKATAGEATRTALTLQRQMIGTPMYMSPEQAERTDLDVDTRSDVYSLGVLLYELLTGTTPFDAERLLDRGYAEMMRVIREETPPTPSTRISKLGETGLRAATQRRSDVRRMGLALRGDLDWIVMRCLEKDRERRYETADGLAGDVERHLRDEPVLAGPPSAAYRLRKFVRRNRAGVLAASAVAIALVLGIAGTTWGMLWALAEKDRADGEAQAARAAEAGERERAAELQQVADFQAEQLGKTDALAMGSGLRLALLDAAPDEQREPLTHALAEINLTDIALGVLRAEIFEPTLEAIDARFEPQPGVRAKLLGATAAAMSRVGLLEPSIDAAARALEIGRRELGDDDPVTLLAMRELGGALHERGRLDEAEVLFREAVSRMRRVFGDEAFDTLVLIRLLGSVRYRQGDFEESEQLMREAYAGLSRTRGDDDPQTVIALDSLGALHLARGELAQAEACQREALERSRRTTGDESLETLLEITNLAGTLRDRGALVDAEALFREALERSRRALGSDHYFTWNALANVGLVLLDQGRLAEAEPLLREALAGQRRLVGDKSQITLNTMNNLGLVLQRQGKLAEAEPLIREAFETARLELGADHPSTRTGANNLGYLLNRLGRYAEAETYLVAALEATRRARSPDHPETLATEWGLAETYLGLGEDAEALPLLEAFCQHASSSREEAELLLLDAYSRTGERTKPLPILRRRVDEARNPTSPDGALARRLAELGQGLLAAEEWAEAEDVLGEVLELFERADPGAWTTFDARSMLGAALLGAGRHAEAEELLIDGFMGLAEREHALPAAERPRLTAALERIVALYTAWELAEPGASHAERAAEWQAELDAVRQG